MHGAPWGASRRTVGLWRMRFSRKKVDNNKKKLSKPNGVPGGFRHQAAGAVCHLLKNKKTDCAPGGFRHRVAGALCGVPRQEQVLGQHEQCDRPHRHPADGAGADFVCAGGSSIFPSLFSSSFSSFATVLPVAHSHVTPAKSPRGRISTFSFNPGPPPSRSATRAAPPPPTTTWPATCACCASCVCSSSPR